jgi:hypothetical protein
MGIFWDLGNFNWSILGLILLLELSFKHFPIFLWAKEGLYVVMWVSIGKRNPAMANNLRIIKVRLQRLPNKLQTTRLSNSM